MAKWGGAVDDWVDLSTGINPCAYPLPKMDARAWTALPTRADLDALSAAARTSYDTGAGVLPVAGAQAAIQMIPMCLPRGTARVLGPTYNEHAAALESAGWAVETVAHLDALVGADLAVVVNPNNPDGRILERSEVRGLAGQVGHLVIDESFADPDPGQSLVSEAAGNMLVLRSFGKFYGLAGLRLGFVLGNVARLAEVAGPWPVSGAAIAVGQAALSDAGWKASTIERLRRDADRLDQLARRVGWSAVGGTTLFRLYDVHNAAKAQDRLAKRQVWSRIFPYSESWMRLGLPGQNDWEQVEAAILNAGGSD